MPDGARAFQPLQIRRGKNLRNEPHRDVPLERRIRPGGGDDARAFLPAMLEREEPVVGEGGGVLMTENGENAALMRWLVLGHAGRRRRESSGRRGAVKRWLMLVIVIVLVLEIRWVSRTRTSTIFSQTRSPDARENA